MSDLIDRNELLNAIEKDVFASDSVKSFVRCVAKNQTTIDAQRWVRCEVDMPTKAGWYLVMDKDGDFNVEKWDNTFNWLFTTPYEADSITHWMPIEPPQEVQE